MPSASRPAASARARAWTSANVSAPSEPPGAAGSSTTAIRSAKTVAPRSRKSRVVRGTSIGGTPCGRSAGPDERGGHEDEGERGEHGDDGVLRKTPGDARGVRVVARPGVAEGGAEDRLSADEAGRHRATPGA